MEVPGQINPDDDPTDFGNTRNISDMFKFLLHDDPEDILEKEPNIVEPGTRYPHVLVTPLVEVFSVSIHSSKTNKQCFDDGRKCEIYGHIQVIDSLGDSFYLFNRKVDNPELVQLDDTLSLVTPETGVIVPTPNVILDVLLFDRARANLLIAKRQFEFSLDNSLSTEHVVLLAPGADSFAYVHCSIFPYAVLATIDVLYFSKDDDFDLQSEHASPVDDDDYDDDDDDDDDRESSDEFDYNDYNNGECGNGTTAHLFGSVIARSSMQSPRSVDGEEHCQTLLFRKPREQSVEVKSGAFIRLSRSVVAVPASCRLVIEVQLSHHDSQQPSASGNVEFKPRHSQTVKKDVMGESGRIRVRVRWGHAYEHFNRSRKLKRPDVDVSAEGQDNQSKEFDKKQKLLLDQQSSAASRGSSIPRSLKEVKSHRPFPLLEVFSVAVHSPDFKPFSFYGTILVTIGEDFWIFRRDKTCPQRSSSSSTLASLKGAARSFSVLDQVGIEVELQDVRGPVISRGYVNWNPPSYEPWFNKRMCSIIRGDCGFAAVYYTIFSDAVEAAVEVKVFGKSLPARVHGELVARYGTYDYSTSNDECFQSVLFQNSLEDNPPLQPSDSGLTLLKSIVSVPRNSSLIIAADLTISSVPHVDEEFHEGGEYLHDIVELKADDKSSRRVGGENFYIEVSAKWRMYPFLYSQCTD